MPKRTGFREEQQPYDSSGTGLRSVGHTRLRIDSAGRVVIPAEMRKAMLAEAGDTVSAQVVDGELKVMSQPVVIARLQAEARKHVPAGISVVDELIAERREEAAREDEKYARLEREAAEIAAKGSRKK